MSWFLKQEFRKADKVVASETVSVDRASYGVGDGADKQAGIDLQLKAREVLFKWFGAEGMAKPDPDQRPE